MIIPKQKPEKPAPPIAPNCVAVKLNSFPQLSRIPFRNAKPTPAARIAIKPAQSNLEALGTTAEEEGSLLMNLYLSVKESGEVERTPSTWGFTECYHRRALI